jgi:hypothetical protein
MLNAQPNDTSSQVDNILRGRIAPLDSSSPVVLVKDTPVQRKRFDATPNYRTGTGIAFLF